MAKVVYSSLVTGIAGKISDVVYYRSSSSHFGYIREYNYPRIPESNHEFGAKIRAIGKLWGEVTPLYKEDLALYLKKYRVLDPDIKSLTERANNAPAIYVKWLFAFADKYPDNITLQDLAPTDFELYPQYNTLSGVISAGFLPKVEGWSELTAPMFSDITEQ